MLFAINVNKSGEVIYREEIVKRVFISLSGIQAGEYSCLGDRWPDIYR